jgi:hypothetical protein
VGGGLEVVGAGAAVVGAGTAVVGAGAAVVGAGVCFVEASIDSDGDEVGVGAGVCIGDDVVGATVICSDVVGVESAVTEVGLAGFLTLNCLDPLVHVSATKATVSVILSSLVLVIEIVTWLRSTAFSVLTFRRK